MKDTIAYLTWPGPNLTLTSARLCSSFDPHLPYVHYSLDWTTGLIQNGVMPFPALIFFSVGEKLIMLIQPTSLLNLLPYPVEATLLESVEGQRSHAYLISRVQSSE